MSLSLGSIVEALGGELHGDATLVIAGLSSLEDATAQQLSFLSHPQYEKHLAGSQAACIIVSPQMRSQALARGACIVSDQPYLYFARVTQLWKKHLPQPERPRVHSSAVIDPEAFVHPLARVGALCVIERGARIGADTELKSRVTVGEDCTIGDRCLLHPGVVIGADGFGFAPNGALGRKSNNWVLFVLAMMLKLGPIPVLTGVPCRTRSSKRASSSTT